MAAFCVDPRDSTQMIIRRIRASTYAALRSNRYGNLARY